MQATEDGMIRRVTAALAMVLACGSAAAADAGDPVVAERGAAQITASAARAMVAGTEGELHQHLAADPAALRVFLRDALLQQAVLAEARAQKWDQRPDVVAALQRAHDQVVAASFIAAQVKLPAGYPSEAEVQSAYARNTAQLMQPRTYHLTQIFVPAASLPGDEARRRLAELGRRVQRSQAGFDNAVGSVPGARYADLGFLPETSLVPAVKSAVAGLPEGSVSDPVCSPVGCSLLRLVATRPAGPAPLAEVRDRLVRALRQQRVAQEEQAYANTLLQRQPVRVNEIELARLAGAAP